MHDDRTHVARRIVATAPVRIADVGGWTDTWFAQRGLVCSLAVGPGVTVVADVSDVMRSHPSAPRLHLADFQTSFSLDEDGCSALFIEHPVLGEIVHRHLTADSPIGSLHISSAVPAGSSLGTSAAVGVALIAAIRAASGHRDTTSELARLAHDAETGAGLQSGVQDHVGAAFGGASLIAVSYPDFAVSPIELAPVTRRWLGDGLRTVFLGRHDSSGTHRMVIDQLQQVGNAAAAPELEALREAATDAAEALRTDNRRAYGDALLRTVEAQRGLHADLIGQGAQQLIDLARDMGGAAKVNGAGGHGGSVTLLAPPDPAAAASFDKKLAAVIALLPGARLLDLHLQGSGVRVDG